MADGGYIKLDRKILDWRWHGNPNTFSVFVHLLMMANYKDLDFENVKIKRGSLATSHASLGNTCGLTINQVRTALSHLVSTGEITIRRHSRFIEITIINYSEYQGGHSQITGKSQSNHNQITGKSQQEKEGNKGNKRKKGRIYRGYAPESPSGHPVERYPCGLIEKPRWMSAEEWEAAKYMTADDIPGMYRGDYDDIIEYLRDRKKGTVK